MSFTSLDFTRQGALNLAVYLPNPNGAVINTPTTPTQATYNFGLNELLVKHGNPFNIGYSNPGASRTVKTAFASYNSKGHLTFTAFSPAVVLSPNASDNAAIIRQTNIPAKAAYVFVILDGQLAQIVPTPPASRRNGTAGLELGIPIFYEPNPNAITEDELNSLRGSLAPLEFKRYSLGETTGALTHAIELTKIEIPVNDLPTEMITTRTSQKITGTFKAPRSRVQALFTGGTAYLGCSNTCAANVLTQLGWKSGNCDDNRVYEITAPGDACYKQLDFLLYAKASHGDTTQEVNFSSEEASHLPISLMEASSSLFKGQHSVSLQVI